MCSAPIQRQGRCKLLYSRHVVLDSSWLCRAELLDQAQAAGTHISVRQHVHFSRPAITCFAIIQCFCSIDRSMQDGESESMKLHLPDNSSAGKVQDEGCHQSWGFCSGVRPPKTVTAPASDNITEKPTTRVARKFRVCIIDGCW